MYLRSKYGTNSAVFEKLFSCKHSGMDIKELEQQTACFSDTFQNGGPFEAKNCHMTSQQSWNKKALKGVQFVGSPSFACVSC